MNDEAKDQTWRMVEGELSLLELGQMVHAPETTVRRYARKYGRWLGMKKDRRGYHFPPAAVATLSTILERVRDGWGPDAIEAELRATTPATVNLEMMTTTTPPLPELALTLERIAAALEALNRQGEILQRIEALEKAKAAPWWRFWEKKK